MQIDLGQHLKSFKEPAMTSDLASETAKSQPIEDRLNKLAEDMAAQKTIGELIKYLVYFWAAISAVLGVFGWSKFSDLDKTVENQVQLQLPRDKQEFAKYRDLVAETELLNRKYKELAKSYEESVAALQYANTTGRDFDIEGRLTALIVDSTRRQRLDMDDDPAKPISLEGTTLEPRWRKDSIATLMAFKESLGKKNYPADFIFNVTQITRRLDQFQLAEDLTKAAFEKDPSPPIRALYLSSRVKNKTGAEREQAFSQLLEMVIRLPSNSPEIVLAETWNAAEDQRRYSEFIAAIDKCLASNKTAPSYIHVIRANAVLRESLPNAVPKAEESLKAAAVAVALESAGSSWFSSTMREYESMSKKIKLSRLAATAMGQRGGEPILGSISQ